MKRTRIRLAPAMALAIVALLARLGWSAEEAKPGPPRNPDGTALVSPDEPFAAEVSMEKAARSMDAMAAAWTEGQKCAHCHTNLAYLVARPLIGDIPTKTLADLREFVEKSTVSTLGRRVAAAAPALALHDACTSGKLSPATRQALERMWSFQQPDGAWPWFGGNYAPSEMNPYYGAAWVAIGVGAAPEGYAQSEAAREGIARLRAYLQKTPPPNLHDKVLLLWAAARLDGLMDAAQKEATVKQLLALQRADGGWNLPSLLDGWPGRKDGPAPDKNAKSDGYATGLAVYVLRQSGVPAERPEIQRGLKWLKSNQRESGHWYTPSPNSTRTNLITHHATCLAVMAIKACQAPDR